MTKPKVELSTITDLSELDTVGASDKGADIELVNTRKEPMGIFFKVMGKHSTAFKEAEQEETDRRMRQSISASRKRQMIPPATAQQLEERANNLLIISTLGWFSGTKKDEDGNWVEFENFITLRGEKLPFSVANARMVYENFPLIRAQIDEAIDDLTNFI